MSHILAANPAIKLYRRRNDFKACSLGLTTLLLAVAFLSAYPAQAEDFAASDKRKHDPIRCTGDDDLVLRNRLVVTDGSGVEIIGNCDLTIVDSVIIAQGYGVNVHGNGDVVLRGSFIQGRKGALQVGGNGDIAYRDSTLRGGFGETDLADLTNQGGNTIEPIPDPSEVVEPVVCEGRKKLSMVGQVLKGSSPVVVSGGCQLLISDSEIHADTALVVKDEGSVRVRNSLISGAVELSEDAKVHAAGSHFQGSFNLGDGRFVDGGGNSGDYPGDR